MNKEQIWIFISYWWTEIGLSEEEIDDLFGRMNINPNNLSEVRKAIFWEYCGAFAMYTLWSFLTIGIILPDWGFEEKYVRSKVFNWLRRPVIFSLFNPLWLLGYLLACLIAVSGWLKLSKRIRRL